MVYCKKDSHRREPDYRKEKDDYRKEKALLLLMAALIVGTFTLVGYYVGMRHAITDTEVSYYAGIVTFELDGRAYEHVASGWYPAIER